MKQKAKDVACRPEETCKNGVREERQKIVVAEVHETETTCVSVQGKHCDIVVLVLGD
jgi:hypothetical protein